MGCRVVYLANAASGPPRARAAGDSLAGDTVTSDTVGVRAASPRRSRHRADVPGAGPNDEIVAYHGRIPPLLDGCNVDADVTYRYFAPFR